MTVENYKIVRRSSKAEPFVVIENSHDKKSAESRLHQIGVDQMKLNVLNDFADNALYSVIKNAIEQEVCILPMEDVVALAHGTCRRFKEVAAKIFGYENAEYAILED